MAHSGKKDPKLSEVKAVLQRLQGFTGEDEDAGTSSASDGGQPAGTAARSPRASAVVTGVMIFALAAGVLGAALLVAFMQAAPPAVESAPATPQVVKAALEVARGLMAKGHVLAARQRLLALAKQGSPDAAWDIARSYDPNVLAAMPEADAKPDIEEAARWYRIWYDAAVKEGLVADSVSLERIIGSMRK